MPPRTGRKYDKDVLFDYYPAFMEQSIDGLMLIDEMGRFVVWNRAMENITGVQREQVLGYPAWEAHRHIIRDSADMEKKVMEIEAETRSFLLTGRSSWNDNMLELTMADANCRQRRVQFQFFPIETNKGFMIGCIARDVSEDRRLRAKLRESQEQLRNIVDNANEIIYTLNRDGIFEFVSAGWQHLLGHAPIEVTGHSFTEFVHQDYLDNCWQSLHSIFETGKPIKRLEYLVCHKDGSLVWNISSVALIRNEKRSEGYLIGIATDITAAKHTERALKESEARLRLIQDNMNDIVLQSDLEGRYLYASPSHERLLGYSGVPGASFFEFIHPDDQEKVRVAIRQGMETLKPVQVQFRQYQAYTDQYIWLESLGSILLNDQGQPVGLQAISRDITARRHYEEQLKYMSFYDTLTGLHNRAYFENEMHHLENAGSSPLGLVVCDVDGLKLVNDYLGHHYGDHLLKVVSNLLRKCFRENDILARVGGDEFAALCPGSREEIMQSLMERINKTVEDYNNSGPRLKIFVSVGYCCCNDGSITIEEMMLRADHDMYCHKNANRERFIEYFFSKDVEK
ncbi:MAG: PAS domain S-box protein [Deltaproteobacteria bacterium]